MFKMIVSLASMLAFGALLIAVIERLCRRTGLVRAAGVMIAAIVVSYCGGVALILVIGSVDAVEIPRLGGVLSVVTFTLIAYAAVISARRGLAKG